MGAGSGGASGAWRTMAAGGSRLPYNLYLDSSYGGAAVWGGAAMPANQTPLLVSVPAGVVAMGSFSRTHTIYGKVPGSMLAGVATAGNADTVFASIFGADATFTYAFSSVSGTPSCTAGTTSTLPFQVRATVINDAVINASNLQFGSSSVLTGTVRANAALALQLTANNAYRIALDGGMHGSVGERRMRNALTGETVRYVISGTPDGPGWGDGTAGTSTVAGTGTGTVQSLPLYGRVPPQPTPSPGDYKDTLTVTVYF
ncbi:spore coat U domain-containing protein [Massilia jejuensis]|uniref:Spore coat U domain-containing protein n=1 Tax=Massilia jejuensis TaxID=648894 RepID=A0ABW0PES2_9BURK